jgi:uncharacterized DUF497 family protein
MDRVSIAAFDWDRGNRDKCQKHGVPISAIESLFRRSIAIFPDPAHSGAEERYKAVGQTDDGRMVLIVFTMRNNGRDSLIRPISARYMHQKEVDYYEEAVTRADNG